MSVINNQILPSGNLSTYNISSNVYSGNLSKYNISSNVSTVNSAFGNAIKVEPDDEVIIPKLVLLDEKTGRKWRIKIYDGELIAEPLELQDKRDLKIKKILNDKLEKEGFL